MLVVDKVDDGYPWITVIDVVSKSRGVNDRKLDLELFLFKLSFDDLNFGQLVKLLQMPTRVVFGGWKLGRKKCVDKSRLSQARLTDDHHSEVGASFCDDFVPLNKKGGSRVREKKRRVAWYEKEKDAPDLAS